MKPRYQLAGLLLAAAQLGGSPAVAAPPATAVTVSTLPAAAPDLVLQGEVTGADHAHYRRLPFTVPAGTERLVVDFDYTGREQRTVIDIGLLDPQGLRGWSGGNKRSFTIAVNDATPSYRPGPLPAGQWHLLLGMPNVRKDSIASFTAKIWFYATDRADLLPAPTTGRGPGWYRGDLHLHSAHSDGNCTAQSGARTPCPLDRTLASAAARGLDFIAITEHNNLSHLQPMRELQPSYDRLLLIPGMELTTFYGHANFIGLTQMPDFTRVVEQADGFAVLVADVHARGGIVSINHPGMPSGEACMGCGWTLPGDAAGLVDAVEVVNGGGMAAMKGRVDSPLSGIGFWTAQLAQGRKPVAIGGSDNHNGPQPLSEAGSVGSPTTVVHADDLATGAILAGIRSGRVFIDTQGTKDRMLDMTARSGTARAFMGGVLAARPGAAVDLTVTLRHAPAGSRIEVLDADRILASAPVVAGIETYDFHLSPARGIMAARAVVRATDGDLLLIGNPVFVRR